MSIVTQRYWYNGDVSLFWVGEDKNPWYLSNTIIKRMTWQDESHVSVFLEGALPAARDLFKIGANPNDTLLVLWKECGSPDYYDLDEIALRLENCQVCFRRIRDIPTLFRNDEDVIRLEVKLTCRLGTVSLDRK